MPLLEELHLDNNMLTRVLIAESTAADGTPIVQPFSGIPNVTLVSIAQNAFTSWHTTDLTPAGEHKEIDLGFDFLPFAFPKLSSLSVCGCEQLPDIDAKLLEVPTTDDEETKKTLPLRRLLSKLTTLDIADCPMIVNPEQTLTILRRHSADSAAPVVAAAVDDDDETTTAPPHAALTILRMTYTHSYLNRRNLYPSEAVARYVTIATIPSLTTLNRAAVRPKERADAEMYYMQRAASSFPKAASGEASAEGGCDMAIKFPEYSRLAAKYPLITAQLTNVNGLSGSDGGDGSSSLLLLTLRLVCDGHAMVEKKVPAMLTVGKLRQLIANTYPHVPIDQQEVTFWNSDGSNESVAVPVPLVEVNNTSSQQSADERSLMFFGVANGATVKLVENK